MNHLMTSSLVTIAILFFCPFSVNAQANEIHPLVKRGYQLIDISATYSFFNDLDHATDTGEIENVSAGYRLVDGAYEIIIDFGTHEEVWFVDTHDFFDSGAVADGISFQRSFYMDGKEEILANITIGGKVAVYLGGKEIIP